MKKEGRSLPGPVKSIKLAIDCNNLVFVGGDIAAIMGLRSLFDLPLANTLPASPFSLLPLSFSFSFTFSFSLSLIISLSSGLRMFPMLFDRVKPASCLGFSFSILLLWLRTSLLLGVLVSSFLNIWGRKVFLWCFPVPHWAFGIAVFMIPSWIASVIFSFLFLFK